MTESTWAEKTGPLLSDRLEVYNKTKGIKSTRLHAPQNVSNFAYCCATLIQTSAWVAYATS